ncbi:MAG: DUF1653 domain-containing protein [Lachnospiraceae bacterium]|nr:DUF1653 domain-containing protein [Lachnospiraceae bacterium]
MRDIRQGQFYRHFKDRLYQVVAVAEHSETGEQMVVYQALYGDYRIYVRPYEMFSSEVDHEKYPDVTQKYRFELVEFTKKQPQTKVEMPAEEQQKVGEDVVNPILMEFLEADSLEEKMHILICNRNKMDDNLLNSIAISLDLVVEKETVKEKYDEILNCISMMGKFECNRFR